MAEIAALVGNPARANILLALGDGRALTATELAYAAHVSPQTTSGHLAQLTASGLLSLSKQGRHSYYCLASPLVGHMLEAIMAVAAGTPSRRTPRWRGDEVLRTARTCYDHLAGRLAVALTDALIARESLVLTDDGGELTPGGADLLQEFGIDLAAVRQRRRVFCRPCLDWSERRPHLAGAVGAAIAARCFDLGWIARQRDSRALSILPAGVDGLAKVFGVCLEPENPTPPAPDARPASSSPRYAPPAHP
jgi:DNA-binding transcriptional ArsR family regulator